MRSKNSWKVSHSKEEKIMKPTLRKAVHEAVLGKELVNLGFRLEEDEDFACLYFKDELIATYNAKAITVEKLRADAWAYVIVFSKEVQ